jgi:hypothetical protein
MANQTIPITLTPNSPPTDVQAANFSQLITLICQYVQGSIRASVSFFLEVVVDPTAFVTNLIFNTSQGVWKFWSVAEGRYVTVTDYIVGDVKNSFFAADQVSAGWVVLNGRQITAIPGLSQLQIDNLTALFPSGMLPTVVPINGADLPPEDSYSGITGVEIEPDSGVIEALPIGVAYDQAEVEALRDNTEILRDSAADLAQETNEIKAKSEELLEALRTPITPPMVSMVYCGQ